MAGTVFISHSKRDAETIQVFCNIFARTNVKARLAEFENYAIPPWTQIKAYVLESNAVFVLLSPHLSGTPYTQNWVSYEVGLACALNKPVWVYEHWNDPVNFPIPYLTDYFIYDPKSREHMEAIKSRVEAYDPTPSFVGLVLGALVGGVLSGGAAAGIGAVVGAAALQRQIPAIPIRCAHASCAVQFRLHGLVQQFQCPACRQLLVRSNEAPALGG